MADDLELGAIIPTIHLDLDGVTPLIRGADGRLHSQNGSRGRPEFKVTGPLMLDFAALDDLIKELDEQRTPRTPPGNESQEEASPSRPPQ